MRWKREFSDHNNRNTQKLFWFNIACQRNRKAIKIKSKKKMHNIHGKQIRISIHRSPAPSENKEAAFRGKQIQLDSLIFILHVLGNGFEIRKIHNYKLYK